jgi:hypothetical protein
MTAYHRVIDRYNLFEHGGAGMTVMTDFRHIATGERFSEKN